MDLKLNRKRMVTTILRQLFTKWCWEPNPVFPCFMYIATQHFLEKYCPLSIEHPGADLTAQ